MNNIRYQNQTPQAQFRQVFGLRNANHGISVSLFINNGRMDTTYAVPFTINPSWDINTCKTECCHKLYNRPLSFARLFTEMGIEILSAEYIAPLQSLVVSQGEAFVPIIRLPQNERENMGLQLDTLLTDIYAQNLPPHPRATDTVKRKLEEWESVGREHMLGKKAKYGVLPPSIGGDNANYITRMMEKMPDELASDDRVVDPQLKRLFDNLQGGIPHIDLSMQMLPNSPSLFPDTSINNQRPTNASQLGQIILQEPYTSNSMGLVASDGKRSVTGSKSSNFSQNGDSLPAGYEYGSPVYHSPFNSSQDQGLNHQTSNQNQNQIQSNFVHPAIKSRVSVDDNHPLTHSRTSLVDPNSMQSNFGARYSTSTNGAGALGYADLQALNQQASPSLSVGAGSYMGAPRSDSIPQQLQQQHPQSRGQGSQASLELGGFSRDSSVPDLKNSVSPVTKGSGVAHTTSDVKPIVTRRKSSKSLDGKTSARPSAQGDGDGDGSVKEEQYRTESHKASEQRSRTRLKDSINELATTVPTLVNVKNPSKAHIIKKATEFVHDTQKTNTELRLEHEKLKSELAALHLKHMKSMNTMNMGNIITVEILSKDFTYIFVDHMWEVFLGYSRSEVLGKTFKDISSCRNCELMLKRSMEIHETMRKKQVWRGLILSKRKDGQAFCCDTTITPVLDDSGDILQFVVNRKKFHILNGVDCQNICRGIMPEPKLTDEDEDNPSTAKLMIEEAILATEKA